MLECTTNQEVSEELERIVKDPGFVVNGIFFLSKYKHKVENEQDKEEIKSKRFLAGIIFIPCEPLRMDMEADFIRAHRRRFQVFTKHKYEERPAKNF